MSDEVTKEQAEDAVRVLLQWAGDDPSRPGLEDTPARVARMYREVFAGLTTDAPKVTTFKGVDQLVIVADITFTSMCEHHLVPFMGRVHIGYLPGEKLAGLSKFARVVDWCARRPQTQEYLTDMIADKLMEALDAEGVVVVAEAEHMCMSIRGVQKPGHTTVTSTIRPEPGAVPLDEFLALLDLRTRR